MAMPDPENVTCNICATTFAAATAIAVVKQGLTIVRCPTCSLVFRARLPEVTDVEALYERDYFVAGEGALRHEGYLDYLADAELHRLNARRRLGRLAGLCEPGSLLDVGCAAGFFVDEAARQGWAARGIDVSGAMVEWGRTTLGADLAVGSLLDTTSDRTEACVTMWDYIEHALDPRGDLERAHARLRPGGVLALSTGDVTSILARVSLAGWHLMTPRHHNYFFSPATMRRLLRDVGFDNVEIRHPGAVFPLRYLAHKAALSIDARVTTLAASRIARSRWGMIRVPVNLWDVMTVVARRPLAA